MSGGQNPGARTPPVLRGRPLLAPNSFTIYRAADVALPATRTLDPPARNRVGPYLATKWYPFWPAVPAGRNWHRIATCVAACLLLHTRMAIARMLSYDNPHLEEPENTLVADDDMMFSLEEIMPEFSVNQLQDTSSSTYGGDWPEGNELLGELSSIPGYAASAVVHTDGEILASHSDTSEVNPQLATLLASTVEVAVRAMWAANTGELESVYVGAQQGSLVIHWVSSARIHFVVVLRDSTGKPGMARHRLGAVIMELRKGLARIIHE